MEKTTLKIGGMTCSACSAKIEKTLSSHEGVLSASVNLGNNTAVIDYDEKVTTHDNLVRAVEKIGYQVIPGGRKEAAEAFRKEFTGKKIDLIIAVIFTVPLTAYAMGHMFGLNVPFDDNPAIFSMIQLALCTPVIFAGRKFFISGIPSLFRRSPDMNTLVALGTGTAFIYSLYCTASILLGNEDPVHSLAFESAAMIITLISAGKYLESESKIKTNDAVEKLLNLAPKHATVIRNSNEVKIPIEELEMGDIILIRPGETVPADGSIIEGKTHINESMLTGESDRISKKEGDKVFNGTVNMDGSFRMVAEQIRENTTLHQIIDMMETAQSTKAPVSRIADRVAGIFVPIVMAVAVASCLIWFFSGKDVSFSLTVLISVLVISCPCALGLATPMAIIVGAGKAANHGIMFRNAAALEHIGKIDVVILDKTGTVTRGEPEIVYVLALKDNVLAMAASAEHGSEHPIGDAIRKKASETDLKTSSSSDFKYIVGKGITSVVDGKTISVGNAALMEIMNVDVSEISEEYREKTLQGISCVYVSADSKLIGMIGISDPVRPSSAPAVKYLKEMNIEVTMVTGDSNDVAMSVSSETGIEKTYSEISPEGKLEIVKDYQISQKIVAMTGDGINDAPALAQSDVGISMGTGTDIAIDSSDIVILNDDLLSVPAAVEIGKRTLRNIKQNLALAFCYNVVCIPVAAGVPYLFGISEIAGMPMIAAAAMSISSVSVVLNSLRLSAYEPPSLTVRNESRP